MSAALKASERVTDASSPSHGECLAADHSHECSIVSDLAASIADSASGTDAYTESTTLNVPVASLQPVNPLAAFSRLIEKLRAAASRREQRQWHEKLEQFLQPRTIEPDRYQRIRRCAEPDAPPVKPDHRKTGAWS